jgi:hypothetical protein
MTVVRLPDGGLWLHSPIALDEALVERLAHLGRVTHLVAPNTLHYWWVPDWKARFHGAEVFAVPGLDRTAKRPLPTSVTLGDDAPPAWQGQIAQLVVRGDALTEAVFLHRPSRTLILTDLIENFEPARVRGFWLRLLLRLAGAADPDGKAPLDMQLTFRRQRPALRAAVRQMVDWDPERIILAHGRWYESGGTKELRRAFRWVL